MWLKKLKQRGQALVMYALFVPLLIGFVGVGMDLGWYYLNVSRLQNAADAAALAGAWKLVEQENFDDYYPFALRNPPSDLTTKEYDKIYVWEDDDGTGVGKYTQTTLSLTEGKDEARLYANKNLIDIEKEHDDLSERTDVLNEWSTVQANSKVTFKAELFAKNIDYQNEETSGKSANGSKYYKVTLSEKISHLFLSGFDPMDATVVAYVVLELHEQDLITSIKTLEQSKTIQNWEYQNRYHDFGQKWNHYRQTMSGSQGDGKNIFYQAGDVWRSETVNVSPDISKSDAVATSANGGNRYKESEVDAINIDFNQDFTVSSAVTEDWDLRYTSTPNNVKITYRGMTGWDATHGYDLRIQGLINLNGAWHNRNLTDSDSTNDTEPDILWTRIEADPMWSKDVPWGNQTTLNSVHQMIININSDNTATQTVKDSDGNDVEVYTYRPYFIFYMGPESNVSGGNGRQSQPVILNLNEDFNGVLYAPNSPVVINGNGHTFTGFVVAKEYQFLKTEADFLAEGFISIQDSYDNTIYINPQDLIDKEMLLTEDELNELIEENNYTRTADNNGYVSLYEKVEAPKYFIIDPRYVKKFDAREEKFSDATDADYVAALKKYKKITDDATQLTQITFLQDTDTFGGYINTATYTVATADLSDTKVDNNYVAVLVGEETKYIAKKNLPYVRVYRKSNGDLYPYVPVCDLRVKTTASSTYEYAGGKHPYGYAGVTLADDDHDAYSGGKLVDSLKDYAIDKNMDMWKVERNVLDTYQNLYKNKQIVTNVEESGAKSFNLKSEMKNDPVLVAEYRKITYNDTVYYLKETTSEEFNEKLANGEVAATYYMKVEKSGRTDNNREATTLTPPIIVDNKGDLQTKPLTAPDAFDAITEAANTALGIRANISAGNETLYNYWNTYTRATNADEQPTDKGEVDGGKYRRTSLGHRDMDYKIPALERVYFNTVFNVKADPSNPKLDSKYSYFQIPELKRVNYTYLNVDELNHKVGGEDSEKLWNVKDMFFTTKRASWID